MRKLIYNVRVALASVIIIIMALLEVSAYVFWSAIIIGILLWILQLITFPLIAVQLLVGSFVAYCVCKLLLWITTLQ